MGKPKPNTYSNRQYHMVIALYFRNHPTRPVPWPAIAEAVGCPDQVKGVSDLLWKLTTGYHGTDPDGPRRAAIWRPSNMRYHRAGMPWHKREDDALRDALAGEGQRRKPPCDVPYIAAVLARTENEVRERWTAVGGDPLEREGFGLGG